MSGNDRYKAMSDAELCQYLTSVEEEYGVRIRVALVPLSRRSGKSSHAVTATPYDPHGKRIRDLDATQALFPGGTSRTFIGAAFYVATQLVQSIDEWSARKQREYEQWEPGVLTPLEEYIAGSNLS